MSVDPASEHGHAERRVDEKGRHLVRSPAGEFVVETPLDEPLPLPVVPYRRPEVARPAPRWVAPVFIGLALLLIPWMVVLATSLPGRQSSVHYRTAWVGFDVLEFLAIAATGWFAYRRSTWVEVTATMTATLLIVDAWFDVLTAPSGRDRAAALVEALVAELPLAAISLWIARHAAAVEERVRVYLVDRSDRQAARLRLRDP